MYTDQIRLRTPEMLSHELYFSDTRQLTACGFLTPQCGVTVAVVPPIVSLRGAVTATRTATLKRHRAVSSFRLSA